MDVLLVFPCKCIQKQTSKTNYTTICTPSASSLAKGYYPIQNTWRGKGWIATLGLRKWMYTCYRDTVLIALDVSQTGHHGAYHTIYQCSLLMPELLNDLMRR